MSDPRNICVVTGTRAEYGLLFWLMKEIEEVEELELSVIATGMHLSPEFGMTYKQIEEDGFTIDCKVDMLLSSDTETGIVRSMGLGMVGFADAFAELQPDLVVVLGDRFEILSAAIAATVARIPLAHLHGGETTEGAFDESFRHSITKMSHLHFTSTEAYRDRVIQLGEQPERVFNFGAPGIDNINRLNLLSRDAFEKSIGFKLGKRNLLVTFHPVTLEDATSEAQFSALLASLDELEETHFVFTKANADTGGKIINQMIDGYASSHPTRSIAHASLGQLRYLSALQYVDGVIGNSSSGLLEVPSFKIGTINIGDRQLGRIRADSVIDCAPTPDQISSALETLFSPVFQSRLANVENPYGGENIAEKIVEVITLFPLDRVLKKKFYDMAASS